jgi:hypothetical protein
MVTKDGRGISPQRQIYNSNGSEIKTENVSES